MYEAKIVYCEKGEMKEKEHVTNVATRSEALEHVAKFLDVLQVGVITDQDTNKVFHLTTPEVKLVKEKKK